MEIYFIDDSKQSTPSRNGMGPLVAIGGLAIQGDWVGDVEKAIEQLCHDYNFPSTNSPQKNAFKWSPGRDYWMHDNLKGRKRRKFFTSLMTLLANSDAKAMVVVEDTCYKAADKSSSSPEMDVIKLLLERIHTNCERSNCTGIVLSDRPGGDRVDEDMFLYECLETLQEGTDYVRPERIALNVLSCPSKYIRLLQAADVVTSCCLAMVSGEDRFAPPIFNMICGILVSEGGRKGGIGLKLHPDFIYANLYHWVLGDTHFYKRNGGVPLPMKGRPYYESPHAR